MVDSIKPFYEDKVHLLRFRSPVLASTLRQG